jgi:hypothetical protein
MFAPESRIFEKYIFEKDNFEKSGGEILDCFFLAGKTFLCVNVKLS